MAGTCHLQPMFARLMRDLPAALLSLHTGTNIYYYGSLSRDTLQSALIGFVQIMREKHPVTPLLVISPTFGPRYERNPGPTKLTHRLIRQELKSACEWLIDRGDRNLHYINGLDLLGPDDADLLLEPAEATQRIHFSVTAHDLVAKRLMGLVRSCGLAQAAAGPQALVAS
jgi:GDSL-like Lipase/Acylhydrolase family